MNANERQWGSGGAVRKANLENRKTGMGEVGERSFRRAETESCPVCPGLTSEGRLAGLRRPTGDGPEVHPYPQGRRCR